MKILTKDKLLAAFAKKRLDAVAKDLIAHGRVVRDATWEKGEGSAAVTHRTATIRRHDHLWRVAMAGDKVTELKLLEEAVA